MPAIHPWTPFRCLQKAGSVIPLAADTSCTDNQCGTADALLVFAGAHGTGEVYGDECDGYAYEQGAYCRRRLFWHEEENQLAAGDLTERAMTAQAAAIQAKLGEELERAKVIICR